MRFTQSVYYKRCSLKGVNRHVFTRITGATSQRRTSRPGSGVLLSRTIIRGGLSYSMPSRAPVRFSARYAGRRPSVCRSAVQGISKSDPCFHYQALSESEPDVFYFPNIARASQSCKCGREQMMGILVNEGYRSSAFLCGT